VRALREEALAALDCMSAPYPAWIARLDIQFQTKYGGPYKFLGDVNVTMLRAYEEETTGITSSLDDATWYREFLANYQVRYKSRLASALTVDGNVAYDCGENTAWEIHWANVDHKKHLGDHESIYSAAADTNELIDVRVRTDQGEFEVYVAPHDTCERAVRMGLAKEERRAQSWRSPSGGLLPEPSGVIGTVLFGGENISKETFHTCGVDSGARLSWVDERPEKTPVAWWGHRQGQPRLLHGQRIPICTGGHYVALWRLLFCGIQKPRTVITLLRSGRQDPREAEYRGRIERWWLRLGDGLQLKYNAAYRAARSPHTHDRSHILDREFDSSRPQGWGRVFRAMYDESERQADADRARLRPNLRQDPSAQAAGGQAAGRTESGGFEWEPARARRDSDSIEYDELGYPKYSKAKLQAACEKVRLSLETIEGRPLSFLSFRELREVAVERKVPKRSIKMAYDSDDLIAAIERLLHAQSENDELGVYLVGSEYTLTPEEGAAYALNDGDVSENEDSWNSYLDQVRKRPAELKALREPKKKAAGESSRAQVSGKLPKAPPVPEFPEEAYEGMKFSALRKECAGAGVDSRTINMAYDREDLIKALKMQAAMDGDLRRIQS